MRIQHNITALNAANRLKANEATVSKNIQKLSSGYRINSAADDAAGLAVSEKMRKQINGLSQAEDNTQNGISLIQTAEGGLNETSAILQRMNTLAVEASNGTYRDNDRQNLQLEINSLNTEVNRISTSTKFNEISLLNGDLSSAGSAGAATATITGIATSTVAATPEKTLTSALTATGTTATDYTVTYKDASGAVKSTTVSMKYATGSSAGTITSADGSTTYYSNAAIKDTNSADATAQALMTALAAKDPDIAKAFTITEPAADGKVQFQSATDGKTEESVLSVSVGGNPIASTVTAGADAYTSIAAGKAVSYTGSNADASVFTVNGTKFAYVENSVSATDVAKLGNDVNIVYTASTAPSTGASSETTTMAALISAKTGLDVTQDSTPGQLDFKPNTSSVSGNALVFQVGAENSDDQRASLSINNMNAASLGLNAIDISNQTGAQAAIDIISKASATVSTTRAQLGALQNELEHTANNLGTMSENLTSAESTIRDVDMTDEYVQYSKNQILSQAANAMLAQANTQPQNVLSLLKG